MTKFREKSTAWQGSQLSYFSHVTSPEDAREDLYCLTLPQTEALIAVIEHWRFLTRWLDDDPDNSPTFASTSLFVDDTQRRLMMPCGSDNVIILSQWTAGGVYQESTDGGETYHDAPNHDPRRNVPLPPPFLPPDTDEEKCTYADSIVNTLINEWINHTGDVEDEQTVIEGILGFLAGIFGAFGVLAAAITLGIAAVIVAFGVVAWKEAWVSAVWDRLRCNLRDNMGDDGVFSQAQVDAVYDRVGDEETGIIYVSLRGMIAALGTQGLTIAARAGRGSPTAVCCPACDPMIWDIFSDTETYGSIVEYGADYVIADLSFAPLTVGEYYLRMKTPDVDQCCKIAGWEVLSGGTLNISVYGACGEAQTSGGAVSLQEFIGSDGNDANRLAFGATGATQVKITFVV